MTQITDIKKHVCYSTQSQILNTLPEQTPEANACSQISTTSASYTMVCPPLRGDNSRALASGLSPLQADKPWYNYFIPPSSV